MATGYTSLTRVLPGSTICRNLCVGRSCLYLRELRGSLSLSLFLCVRACVWWWEMTGMAVLNAKQSVVRSRGAGQRANTPWEWHKHEHVRVPEHPPTPPQATQPPASAWVFIPHLPRLPSVEWDVAIYRQICLIIPMLRCDLSVLKAGVWTPHARPCAPLRSLFLPVYIHLGFICNRTSQNNVRLLRQQQNTWDIFPRLSSKGKKKQIIAFDPGVLSSLECL